MSGISSKAMQVKTIDVYSSSIIEYAKDHYVKYLEKNGYKYRQIDLFRSEKACIVLLDEVDYIDTIKLYHLVANIYDSSNVIILMGDSNNIREFKATPIESIELVSRPMPNQRSRLVTESNAINGILKQQFSEYLERNELPVPKQVMVDITSFRTPVFKKYLGNLLSSQSDLFKYKAS